MVSAVRHLCSQSQSPDQNRGQMHKYNVGAPFEMIAIDVAGTFPRSDQRNRYLLIAVDYFMKWPKAYAIPNQEPSTVAEGLITNFFCRLGVRWELHRDQGRNFEYSRLQPVLQSLGVSKMRITSLHPQLDGMVDRYIKRLWRTYERSSHRTRRIGTPDCSSSSWLTGHSLTITRVWSR
jgi:hypothetical protein